KRVVEEWLASLTEESRWEWKAQEKEAFKAMLQMRIGKEIDKTEAVHVIPKRRFGPFHFVAVAAVILIMGAGVYSLFLRNKEKKETLTLKTDPQPVNDIQPGENGAILTLANGEKIVLDSAGTGTLAIQSDVKVIN